GFGTGIARKWSDRAERGELARRINTGLALIRFGTQFATNLSDRNSEDAIEHTHTMPTYIYKARNMRGKAVSGTVALTSERSAREHLRLNDLFVTDLFVSSDTEEVKAPFFRRSVKLSDLVVFSRQFASMVKAGVPIVQTLDSLAEQTGSPVLGSALEDVRKDVETG